MAAGAAAGAVVGEAAGVVAAAAGKCRSGRRKTGSARAEEFGQNPELRGKKIANPVQSGFG